MKSEIIAQKLNMKLAINWLDLIEFCEQNIAKGIEVAYFKEKKEVAVEAYAEVMSGLVVDVMNNSQSCDEIIAA